MRGAQSDAGAQDFSVPKRFFAHYYAYSTAWTTVVLTVYGFCVIAQTSLAMQCHGAMVRDDVDSWAASLGVLLLLLCLLQAARRLYESCYISTYSASARLHWATYLLGMLHYTFFPLSVATEVPLTRFDSAGARAALYVLAPLGLALFVVASAAQQRHHVLLAALRLRPAGAPPAQYSIPRGGWFELVSCPHYLCEVLIYLSLALIPGGRMPALWLQFVWVAVNQVLTADRTHQWYLRKFSDYPKQRRRIIPWLL